jgi:hypothetical protein
MERILETKAICLHCWEQSVRLANRLRGIERQRWLHHRETTLVHALLLLWRMEMMIPSMSSRRWLMK